MRMRMRMRMKAKQTAIIIHFLWIFLGLISTGLDSKDMLEETELTPKKYGCRVVAVQRH